ncbi:MAG: bifunctional demethylmenaquinone methyltransferase/2-methoxy-6-polyprenyl-1,4-benzoquinol methylase UbiE [Candidatus Puniceispirillaceae bacterium]
MEHKITDDQRPTDDELIDFGFQSIPRDEKESRVKGVFSSVASNYDIMNDLMSFGIHRLWKDALMDWLAPQSHQQLVDLAGGTGDVALRFLKRGGGSVKIVDINQDMLRAGQGRSVMRPYADQLEWIVGNAESLPLENASADRVTIAFGLRNVTDRAKALRDIHRVLKPGGRFCCLEFSSVENPLLARLYDEWSFKILPQMGQIVAKDRESYQYLVESIRQFPDQYQLADMMSDAGFAQVRFRNLSGGIAAIHSGWKLD